jgi:general secretion pathway protein K
MTPSPPKPARFKNDAGAALVLTLSMVVFMAMIALVAMEATMMGARRTANQVDQAQARWFLSGAETFAGGRLKALIRDGENADVDQSDWQGRPFAFPLDQGALSLTLYDGANCFNLNSLVLADEGGALSPNPSAQVQLARLIDLVGVRSENPAWMAAALTDWIDPDSIAGPGGGEDEAYGGADAPYRVANVALADVAELTRVRGFSPAALTALRPYICVRPGHTQTVLNPNTLTQQHAPLMAAMVGQTLPQAAAEALIRARPRGGWDSLEAFLAEPQMVAANLSESGRLHFDLASRYYVVVMDVQNRGARETGVALIDATQNMRVVRRIYGVSDKEKML